MGAEVISCVGFTVHLVQVLGLVSLMVVVVIRPTGSITEFTTAVHHFVFIWRTLPHPQHRHLRWVQLCHHHTLHVVDKIVCCCSFAQCAEVLELAAFCAMHGSFAAVRHRSFPSAPTCSVSPIKHFVHGCSSRPLGGVFCRGVAGVFYAIAVNGTLSCSRCHRCRMCYVHRAWSSVVSVVLCMSADDHASLCVCPDNMHTLFVASLANATVRPSPTTRPVGRTSDPGGAAPINRRPHSCYPGFNERPSQLHHSCRVAPTRSCRCLVCLSCGAWSARAKWYAAADVAIASYISLFSLCGHVDARASAVVAVLSLYSGMHAMLCLLARSIVAVCCRNVLSHQSRLTRDCAG